MALLVRLLALPVAGLASLLPMRWIDDQRSVTEFAFLTLVYGLPMLFTFGELGYGGVASSAVGARRDEPAESGRIVGAILTLYLSVAALISVVVVLAAVFGGSDAGPGRWLGFPGLDAAAAVALVLAALGIPASLGARVLIGLDRAVLVVALQALPAVLSAALVWVLLHTQATATTLGAALIAGTLIINVPLTVVALASVRGRLAPLTQLRSRLAEAGFPAWANFASSVSAISLAQLPRLVLAHRGSDAAVAEIGLALVFFVPAASLVFVSGQALWSDYSHANAHADSGGGLTRGKLLHDVRHSAILGVIFSVAFAVAGPIAAHIFTPGVGNSLSLYIALSFLLLAFAIDLPLNVAMLTGPMANRRGTVIALQIPVSLVVSLLIPHPSGVSLVWVQTVTLLVIVFLPALWLSMRLPAGDADPAEPATAHRVP